MSGNYRHLFCSVTTAHGNGLRVCRHSDVLVLSQLTKGFFPIRVDEIKSGDPISIENPHEVRVQLNESVQRVKRGQGSFWV